MTGDEVKLFALIISFKGKMCIIKIVILSPQWQMLSRHCQTYIYIYKYIYCTHNVEFGF